MAGKVGLLLAAVCDDMVWPVAKVTWPFLLNEVGLDLGALGAGAGIVLGPEAELIGEDDHQLVDGLVNFVLKLGMFTDGQPIQIQAFCVSFTVAERAHFVCDLTKDHGLLARDGGIGLKVVPSAADVGDEVAEVLGAVLDVERRKPRKELDPFEESVNAHVELTFVLRREDDLQRTVELRAGAERFAGGVGGFGIVRIDLGAIHGVLGGRDFVELLEDVGEHRLSLRVVLSALDGGNGGSGCPRVRWVRPASNRVHDQSPGETLAHQKSLQFACEGLKGGERVLVEGLSVDLGGRDLDVGTGFHRD